LEHIVFLVVPNPTVVEVVSTTVSFDVSESGVSRVVAAAVVVVFATGYAVAAECDVKGIGVSLFKVLRDG
jgi:predicted nuclease with RNAse H fold